MNAYEFDTACKNLAYYMHQRAQAVTRETGISYIDADECEVPSTGRGIVNTFAWCIDRKRPFPISREGNDTAVYGAPANLAFRFWHDYLHYSRREGVGLLSELRIARIHREAAESAFGKGSLEARILYADVAAQALHYAASGKFVEDQRSFLMDMVRLGFTKRDVPAILATLGKPMVGEL